MLHIYTGNGKGKTTAAAGLAVRGAGAGFQVYFYQFLKDGSSSEAAMLRKLGIITENSVCTKFAFAMTEKEKAELRTVQNNMLLKIRELITSKTADMIILDEFFGAYSENLLDRRLAESFVEIKENCEIILTGRNAPDFFLNVADYATEMKEKKHPYNKGIKARKGIEY